MMSRLDCDEGQSVSTVRFNGVLFCRLHVVGFDSGREVVTLPTADITIFFVADVFRKLGHNVAKAAQGVPHTVVGWQLPRGTTEE
jgi:hypothetical protein